MANIVRAVLTTIDATPAVVLEEFHDVTTHDGRVGIRRLADRAYGEGLALTTVSVAALKMAKTKSTEAA